MSESRQSGDASRPWEQAEKASWWGCAQALKGMILDVDGVLTDGRLYYGAEGELMRAFSVRDGLGLALLRDVGFKVAIVSGRESSTVAARARELGIDPCLTGHPDKAAALLKVVDAWGIEAANLAAVGDDLIDYPLLKAVGLSMAPNDAHSLLRERVDVVLPAPGGRGAVREACELILHARGHWPDFEERFQLRESSS